MEQGEEFRKQQEKRQKRRQKGREKKKEPRNIRSGKEEGDTNITERENSIWGAIFQRTKDFFKKKTPTHLPNPPTPIKLEHKHTTVL